MGICRVYNMDAKKDRNICNSIADAKAHLALMQLHQLRDYYRQGWVPDWDSTRNPKYKYCILKCGTIIHIEPLVRYIHFLSFQTYKLAEQFLDNFRELIEQAGDLI